MSWYHFFFLKKSKFQRLLWGQYGFSFQSSLLPDPQALKWKLTLKLVTPRQDPQPENSAWVRPVAAYLPGPESRLKRITEIYLQELKAKGIFFFFGYKVYCIFLSLLSFLKIIYLFYFTTLYWFCHTLTWICFNLSSLCTGWPKCLFKIFQSNLWPSWSFWPTQ